MATSMLRVSHETRDTIMAIAERDYGGVTADEALRRLAREHWQRQVLAAVDSYREQDPAGWSNYLNEAVDLDAGSARAVDPQDGA